MELLQSILENTNYAALSALILGLMTAISPCPMATNITAIGFLGKDVSDRKRVFISGLVYTLGRAFSYTSLAFILFLGADQLKFSRIFQQYGERILGPLLVLIGLVMLGIIKLNFPGFNKLSQKFEAKEKHSFWDVFLVGVLFALAFCPYSGVLYFGMLIPMTIQSASGLVLPIIFAIATALPVIVFAWLIAFAIAKVGSIYSHLKVIEIWVRRVVATMFIGVGIYYIIIIWFS
ncbi:aromatic aminobenezylarsenical efflux permease ArsG family transporter [uncultured Sunxiuqinia sp.]|uniref:aromatic aminobenezylarsenical efflux permease ArsG family transporter n=1 Tax=uncultured Sunxiuqinia sp. TaxID=1573825 RepID=UPI002AA6E01C|nr:aromatic aminobenezylarsenical efflux permease ArsG family transporter [uncultured Sunxiuqinia sp.]